MLQKIKLFVILPLIILFISLALANLKPTPPPRLQPSPSPSPLGPDYIGWQEFTNETYKYKIKYPHNWYFHENIDPPPPTTILVSNLAEKHLPSPYAWVEIFVDPRDGRTLDNYEEIQTLVDQGHVARPLEVSQSPAILIDHLGEGGDIAHMYVEHGDYIYRLIWDGSRADIRGQFKDKCLAIMASLSFLD